MINTGPAVSLVAVATLCTVIYIGLGFLPRPSRTAAIWSCALAGTTIASYTWLAADAVDNAPLRGIASGVMLAMTPLLWLGLRARRRALGRTWIVVLAFFLGAPTLLGLTVELPLYLTFTRVTFAVASVFVALGIAELIRLGPHLRDEILPLAIVSAAFVLFSLLSAGHEVFRLTSSGAQPTEEQFDAVRNLNMLGSLLYIVCTTVTALLLTRQPLPAARTSDESSFETIARSRLTRAQAADDRWWSVLVVRLDDPVALREASSTNAFDLISSRFSDDVQAALPAEADIVATDTVEFVVLLPRPEGAVRQLLVRLLARVSESSDDTPLAVRLSASVGWSGVDAAGYDLDALIASARAAATRAQDAGGDRWERAEAAA